MKFDFTSNVLSRRAPAPTPVVHTVPDGVVFGRDVASGAPVAASWPDPNTSNFTAVFGAPGSGKTVTMVAMLAKLIAYGRTLPPHLRPCLQIPDPKNDIAELLAAAVASLAPSALQDLIILSPFGASGVALNFTHLKTKSPKRLLATALTDIVSESTASLGSGSALGPQQRLALGILAEACVDSTAAGSSLLWAVDAASGDDSTRALLGSLTNSRRAAAWLSSKHSPEVLASLVARLSLVFPTEEIENSIAAPNCVSFEELVSPGKVVIWQLGDPPGGLQVLTRAFSAIAFRLTVDELMQRPTGPGARNAPALIAVDELQVLASILGPEIIRLNTLGRSRAIGAIFATQGLGVISEAAPTLLKTIFSNVNRKLVGRMSVADAHALAAEQAEHAPGQSQAEARERLARTITGLQPRHFVEFTPGINRLVRADDVDVDAWLRAAESHRSDIAAARNRYAVPTNFQPVRLYDLQGPQPEPTASATKRSRWG